MKHKKEVEPAGVKCMHLSPGYVSLHKALHAACTSPQVMHESLSKPLCSSLLQDVTKVDILSYLLLLWLGRHLGIHEANSFLMTQNYDLILDIDP